MPLTLQTFSTVADAGAALKTSGTRYLGGGTLAVRAANEGDLSFSTLVRATDPALSAIAVEGDSMEPALRDAPRTDDARALAREPLPVKALTLMRLSPGRAGDLWTELPNPVTGRPVPGAAG